MECNECGCDEDHNEIKLKERARIMAIIEAKKKMYSESNGLVYVLDIILKEIESKK